MPAGNGRLLLAEAKSARTLTPAAAQPLLRLRQAVDKYSVQGYVVHRPPPEMKGVKALYPGAEGVSIDNFLQIVAAKGR